MTNETAKTKPIIWCVCILIALAGLLFGIEIGLMAQAQDFIVEDLGLTGSSVISTIIAILMVGAMIGALGAGYLARVFGRKQVLFLAALCFTLGVLGCTVAQDGITLIIFRLILGFAIGFASFTAPLYLSEVAPTSHRGLMITLYQLMIVTGIFVSYLSNSYIFSETFRPDTGMEGTAADYLFTVHTSWRWMFGVSLLPASIFLIGSFFIPQSPRWLVMKGRTEETRQILRRIRNSDEEAEQELVEIISNVKNNQSTNSIKFFLENKFFRKTVFLGIALQVMQQLTGINAILYFAPKIITDSGFSEEFANSIGTIMIGGTNLLATFLAIYLVEKAGRKPTLVIGLIVLAASLFAVFGLKTFFVSELASYLALGFVLLFIVGFAFSAGPLVWVLCSEIQPQAGRELGVTCSTGTNWIANALVAAAFLPLMGVIGINGLILIYGVCCVLGLIMTILYVPETKGVSLEKLESNLMNGVRLRDIGNPNL